MNQITQTGGARVGWLSASWPMAKLSVSEEALTLKVSILGTFEFRRGQIIRLTKCGFIPVLYSGVKIEHNIAIYPKTIIFWTLESPKKLIASIEACGLLSDSSNL